MEALRKSLDAIVARHESLRTTFDAVDGNPVQVISENRPLDLSLIDLSELPRAEREEEMQRLLKEEAQRPFDLSQDLMLRATLLRLDREEQVLLLVMHHIASDGWSTGVLCKELTALYESVVTGKPSPLPDLPIQYADFAVWQRNWLQGEVLETQLSYWKKQLDGIPPVLELPTDRQRPAIQTYHGAVESAVLPKDLSETLKELSKTEDVTLFMILIAAFKTLLYRYTGQEDIIVGSPIANRTRVEIEGLIGFFVNTLALRTDLSGNPSFRELLGRVRDVAFGAYAHQDLPFEKLVEELQPERNMSHSPFFQVMFALQNVPRNPLELSDLTLTPLEFDSGTAKFDLTLFMFEEGDEIRCNLEYNTDLFDATTITRMLGHYQTLLESVVANPDQSIEELPLLTKAEQHQLLVEWNDTQTDYPKDKCIHQLFEEQVERTPDAIAVVFEDKPLTYRELNAQGNQLAHYLLKLGVGPEVLVGICVERSLEMVVGLLGILKAGGAYVPLDPAYPRERLVFMLSDSQAPVLLTQEKVLAGLPEQKTNIVCLDTHWERISQMSDENPVSGVGADNLAYVIYTSGSTGKPKGVAIEHNSTVTLLYWAKGVFDKKDFDGILASTSICFDLSVFELFFPLGWGGKIILAKNILQLPNLLSAQEVTQINTIPSALAELLRVDGIPESVRTVSLAGELLHTHLVRQIYEQTTVQKVYDLYGPSEDTTYSTFALRSGSSPTTIGRPIANTQIYILDHHLQPVPIGVPGELYIGGAGLARGYLNRPELTAEKFIPNPFRDDSSTRLYKTGDLVRYLPDGNIEFLGRLDHQVKIRGFRVELGEIETVLGQHPAVRDVVVLAREDEPGDKRLVAYIVPAQEHTPTISELRDFLKQKLPGYMIPSAFVMLDALPLTPNGKVDRRALPAPDHARPELEGTFVAPRTPIEEILAGIWAEVLRLEQVGIHDNFFELGGHSLLATQVISRLRDTFQVDVPIRSLFEIPTVAALAERLKTCHWAAPERQAIPSASMVAPEDPDRPLSFAQQRLWFLAQMESGSSTYNIPVAYRIEGQLNIDALEQSLGEIVRRHEILRTTFPAVDGQPFQAIAPDIAWTMQVVNLQDLHESQREGEVQRLTAENAQRPFDLAQGPLFRVKLLRLDEAEHVLLLTMHHIISDGWSMGILLRELSALYEAFSNGSSSPLSKLPIQYADFAYWQRQWLQGALLEKQLSYWRQQLGDSPPVLELPTDRPRPAVQTFRGARQSLVLSKSLSESLKALSQQEGGTLFMTLLVAFKTLLYHYTGQEDILVGSPIANRTHLEIEGLIGFFVNTLVLRTDLSGNPMFRELLHRVREVALGAYAHQDLPFEKLVEELAPERDLSRNPLFDVMFTFQNVPEQNLELPGLTLSSLEVDSGTSKFNLTLLVEEGAEGLKGTLEYNTDMFDPATIKRMLGHFQTLLESIVASPELRLSDLPLLTEAERRQLLVEWNDTKADYPKDWCIHQLFEEQVEQTPDAIAVVFENKQLTYSELNAKANQLAHYLRKLGVGPETLVGIGVERSLEMIVGLLGILKAGGAYVPLDPAYPRQRLAFMLEDTQVQILLTQEKLLPGLPEHKAHVVCLDTNWELISQESNENSVSGVMANNLAYVIYTSGSTGNPKGVAVEHAQLLNYSISICEQLELIPGASFAMVQPLTVDSCITVIFPSLCTGGVLHVISQDSSLDSHILSDYFHCYQIDCLKIAPSHLTALHSALSQPEEIMPHLRLVVGGEASQWGWVQELQLLAPNCIVFNHYGPTETTVGVLTYRVEKRKTGYNYSTTPLGRPIANTQIYILDRLLQPVPIGVVGELHIGGANLARGYLNRPELTAEKFIPNPFSNKSDDRLYKTGDLARYLPDGNIEFLGRIDSQVKIRGFRIELGEVETALHQHHAVQEAVVVVWEDIPGDKRLVGYIVPNQERTPTVSELSNFLKNKLPDYMVPFTFIMLDALPLTPHGKVDRRALPAPNTDRPELEATFVAPHTPMASLIAEIWQEVLGVEKVGVYDNFFDLGGHSLLSMQVIAKLEKQLGVRVNPREFILQTLGQLAASYEEKMPLVQHSEPKSFARELWHTIKSAVFRWS